MQTCTRCHSQSPDEAQNCAACGADLSQYSSTSAALKRFQDNPRVVMVRISVAGDACPACQKIQGTYPKDAVPRLPVEGCSHSHGCRCSYDPVLSEIFP